LLGLPHTNAAMVGLIVTVCLCLVQSWFSQESACLTQSSGEFLNLVLIVKFSLQKLETSLYCMAQCLDLFRYHEPLLTINHFSFSRVWQTDRQTHRLCHNKCRTSPRCDAKNLNREALMVANGTPIKHLNAISMSYDYLWKWLFHDSAMCAFVLETYHWWNKTETGLQVILLREVLQRMKPVHRLKDFNVSQSQAAARGRRGSRRDEYFKHIHQRAARGRLSTVVCSSVILLRRYGHFFVTECQFC